MLNSLILVPEGGAEASIIERWKQLAQADPDARRRADYAGLALVFAELTDCRPLWKQALQGWNVEKSLQVLEWQAEAEKRGLARGQSQAKVAALLHVLTKRFRAVPADVERSIRETSDLEQLNRWLDAALDAATLSAFRQKAGLSAQNGGRRQTGKTKRSTGRRKELGVSNAGSHLPQWTLRTIFVVMRIMRIRDSLCNRLSGEE
jgi:hypothetical protein